MTREFLADYLSGLAKRGHSTDMGMIDAYVAAAVRDAVEAERERVKTALGTLFEHARVTHLGMLGDRPETTVAFFDGFRDGIYEARAAAARIRGGE